MNIFYTTSNTTKFQEACHVLYETAADHAHYTIVQHALDLDELQGSTLHIARHKALQAYNTLKAPVIIDDVSVHCPALGGLPGPYIRSFLESLGEEGLYKLLSNYEDRSCQITCTIGYLADAHDEPAIFEGSLKATIVAPKGALKHGKYSWNRIVQLEGCDRTVGEMTLEEFSSISPRSIAVRKLKEFLLAK